MKKHLCVFFCLSLITVPSWCQQEKAYELPKSKRFINKVEFVMGSGLCFNHGNMFIENYRGEYANGNYVENRRLTKLGYSIGIGAYHSVNDRIGIKVRVLWEQKGYKSELNTTLFTSREFRESDYTYNYFTIPVTAKLFVDKKRRFTISLGGYVSQLNRVRATEKFYNALDNTRTATSFIGRTLVGFDADGGINTASFIPGLQGFEELDYGVVFGLGYELKIKGNSGLVFQILDSYGLANINKPNFTSIPSPDEKNHTISLMVGYIYQLKTKSDKI